MLPSLSSADREVTSKIDANPDFTSLENGNSGNSGASHLVATEPEVLAHRWGRIRQNYLHLTSRLYYSPAGWALLDQLIVSGMRFAATVLVGRFCGFEDLAIYVLSFSAILVVSISHESLIAKPYQVFSQGLKQARHRTYSGSTLLQMLALAGLFSVITLVVALSLLAMAASFKVFLTSLILTITFPGILLWEFVRRQAFAAMDMRSAAVLDGCLAFLQLSSLLGLGLLGELTVVRALAVIGMSSAVIGVVRLFFRRYDYQFNNRRIGLDALKNWRFGRWFFAGQFVGQVQSYAIPWILTLCYSAEKTGILMACQTLVLLSNPLLLGLSNWLGPASVRTYVSQGIRGLNRLIFRVSLISIGCMLAFAVSLLLLGEWILILSFGPSYAGYGHLVAITGITALGFSMTISGSSGLAAILYPRVILYGTILGSIVAVLSLPLLVHYADLTGAAWALAAGSLTSGCFHWLGYFLVSKATHFQPDVQAMEIQ